MLLPLTALTDALNPAGFSQHKLFLTSFWLEDPVNWFQPYEGRVHPGLPPCQLLRLLYTSYTGPAF